MTLTEARSYSTNQLLRLEKNASKGDENSLYTLEQINIRLKRESNNRLENLERHGYTQYAYDLATSFTKTAYKSNRFKGIEITDPKDLRRQIMQMQVFLSKRTSLVVGQKEVENVRIETLRKREPFVNWNSRKIKEFLKFLGDRNVRDLVDSHTVASGEQVDIIFGAYTKTKRSEIEEMIQRYIDTQNGLHDVGDEDFLGYDQLMQYLKNPKAFKQKE